MKKKLLNLSAIILGVFLCLGFSKVQAANTTFNVQNLTRENLQSVAAANSLNVVSNFGTQTKTLKLIDSGYSTQENSGKKVWKVVNPSNSNEIYYCLSREQGFSGMAENQEDEYPDEMELSMSNLNSYSTRTLNQENYNKILWILNVNIDDSTALMNSAGIDIYSDATYNLTKEDILIAQKLAIWHFTDGFNAIDGIGGIPSQKLVDDTTGDTITESRQYKLKQLYNYFVNSASGTTPSDVEHTLTLSNTNAEVTEEGDYFVAGPFNLTKNNVTVNNLQVKLRNIVLPTSDYLVVNSKTSTTNITNYNSLNNFYIKILKTKITSDSKLEIEASGTYNTKTFKLFTDIEHYNSTQPVVLIKKEQRTISTNEDLDININLAGSYNLVLVKEDETGKVMNSTATFEVNDGQKRILTVTGQLTIAEEVQITSENVGIQDIYTIKELVAPDDYCKFDGTITVTVTKSESNGKYIVSKVERTVTDGNANDVHVYLNENGNIYVEVKNYPEEQPETPEFDLALRKFIIGVNKEEYKNEDETYTRAPKVDTSTIATTGTATYKHTKQPVSVQKGDIVTYTIRVYNEGKVDGYVNKISDHLPEFLIPILGQDGTKEYTEEIKFNVQDRLWSWVDIEKNIVSTTITSKNVDNRNVTGETFYANRTTEDDKLLLKKFEEGKDLDFIDVQIKCLVKDDPNLKTGTYLTNIAEIVDAEDINGEHSDGKDSVLDGVKNGDLIDPTDTSDLYNYKNDEALSSDSNSYIEGQEDDDDFEKVIVEKFDLALRKFITKIGNTEYNREPQIGNWTLDNGTTVEKIHSKDPLTVKKGDIITYTLRVYNEGTLDGKATKVIDYIPEGLEFIDKTESSINNDYDWKIEDGKLVTSYLDNDSREIKAVTTNTEGKKELDHQDILIQLRVTADPKDYIGKVITNWAEIGEESNKDIDSYPGNGYEGIASKEDDVDYEPVVLGYFDLALRKFITRVGTVDYNNRAPEVDTSKYGTLDENGKKITTFTYKQTKDPVIVETGSTVIYTIRVYNEGSVSGYAQEITDNIPEGLEFLPEDKTNTDYKWTMLDEQGNVTKDTSKAKKITTTYLAEDLLNAYQKGNGSEVISFKDVKVAFKVTEPNTSDRLVINTAEISKASDDDIDSTPGNGDLSEDDIDREYLKVKYFDLALKKWVTETRVTYNGKTKTKKTGFNENSTEMAKVDLVGKNIKKTTVKFVYKIKVINEGEVAGFATEVEDYIPKGLKFVQADNPKWTLQKNGVAVTDQLKDTLLQPGESATVEIVLTWKNSSTNMGVKTNWAEIKEDSGDDIDSTPDNNKKNEDDIDNAKVILSIKTGSAKTYIILTLISVTVLAGGAYAIKKYVINK